MTNKEATLKGWERKFDTKVKELNDLSVALHTKIYQGTITKTEIEESDSTVVDFGMKIFRGNEIFTVTDWGNVKKFISSLLKQQKKLISKEIKKNRPKETDVKCLWCGRNYFEHDIPPYGEAVAKTPCLGRREGFYPDNKRTLSEYDKVIADTLK